MIFKYGNRRIGRVFKNPVSYSAVHIGPDAQPGEILGGYTKPEAAGNAVADEELLRILPDGLYRLKIETLKNPKPDRRYKEWSCNPIIPRGTYKVSRPSCYEGRVTEIRMIGRAGVINNTVCEEQFIAMIPALEMIHLDDRNLHEILKGEFDDRAQPIEILVQLLTLQKLTLNDVRLAAHALIHQPEKFNEALLKQQGIE